MLPLRQQVVDAVEADHRLHNGRDRGNWIIPVAGREQRFRAGKRHQRHQMRARGIPHQADAIRIDAEILRLGAHELDRRLDVVDGARKCAGLAQPVVDAQDHVAVLGQKWTPMPVAGAAAVLPASAMHRDDRRRPRQSFRLIEIGDELGPVVLRVFHVGLRNDLVIRLRGGRGRKREHTPGCHETPPSRVLGASIVSCRIRHCPQASSGSALWAGEILPFFLCSEALAPPRQRSRDPRTNR